MKYLNKLIALASAWLLLIGCHEPSQQSNIIKIGAALPLTGDIASYGKSARSGIDLALNQLNKDSNNKFKIEVDYQDTKGDKQTAVNITQKFATVDKYPIIIGEAASSISQAMASIATASKVLQISPVSSSPDLTRDDYFFRVCPSDAFQATISANWISTDGHKSVGILYVNNAWGRSLMELFKSNFEQLGGQIKDVESSDEGQRDFKTQIGKLLHSNIDAIYCPTYGKEGGVILKQLKEMGNTLPIYGADVWSSPELQITAKGAAEGVKIVKPSEMTSNVYAQFKDDFSKKYNTPPDIYAAYSYDIIMIIHSGIENGAITGEEMKKFLLNMKEYGGVSGPTKFDKNGDCNSKPFIKQIIKNGNYVNI
jgi:branched-chain amino acid transport system substrate-binding protein